MPQQQLVNLKILLCNFLYMPSICFWKTKSWSISLLVMSLSSWWCEWKYMNEDMCHILSKYPPSPLSWRKFSLAHFWVGPNRSIAVVIWILFCLTFYLSYLSTNNYWCRCEPSIYLTRAGNVFSYLFFYFIEAYT